MELNKGTNYVPSLTVCNHPLTKGLNSNTVAEIEAQESPSNEAPHLSTILAES